MRTIYVLRQYNFAAYKPVRANFVNAIQLSLNWMTGLVDHGNQDKFFAILLSWQKHPGMLNRESGREDYILMIET